MNNFFSRGREMKPSMTMVMMFVFVTAITLGCGQGDDQEFSYSGYSLEAENGGFTTGDMAPVFAEELAAIDAENQIDFALDDQAEMETLSAVPSGTKVYTLGVAWGQFPFNPRKQDWTSWKGMIFVKNARVFVKRAIFYERHDFFKPCANRQCVRINSRTLPHHDGLILKIVPVIDDPAVPPQIYIGFEGLYGRPLRLDQIDGLTELAVINPEGDKVVLNGFAHGDCPQGALGGVWKRVNRRGGAFAGKWIDEDGRPNGNLAGIWGVRRDGEKVFFGVYSGNDGEFRGLLKGKYKPLENLPGGVFAGHWETASGMLGGILMGRYGPNPNGLRPESVFRGIYAANCGQFEGPPDLPPEPADCLEDGTCDSTGEGLSGCTCAEDDGTELADCTCQ
jgi:hypothetical protein